MENHQFKFMEQKNSWGLTVLCIVLCMLFAPFITVTAFLPRMMTLIPIALLVMMGYVGWVSVVVCSGIIIGMTGFMMGFWGAVGAAVFIIPVIVASVLMSEQNMEFWKAGGLCSAIMLGSEYMVLMIVVFVTGTDTISAVIQLFVDFFNENAAMTNVIVDALIQSGAVTTSSSVGAISTLTQADRLTLLQSLLTSMESLLRMEMPMQVATGAVSAGILGQFIMRKSMRKRGEKVDCPPIRTWMIPDGWGRVMLITVALLYLLNTVSSQTSDMFNVTIGVFEQVLALQGIACMCHVMHQRGHGSGSQILMFILGYFLLNLVAVIIGIADQAFDFTHRRAAIREKMEQRERDQYDPRAKRDD